MLFPHQGDHKVYVVRFKGLNICKVPGKKLGTQNILVFFFHVLHISKSPGEPEQKRGTSRLTPI